MRGFLPVAVLVDFPCELLSEEVETELAVAEGTGAVESMREVLGAAKVTLVRLLGAVLVLSRMNCGV
jgi:hypothetical protein